MTSDRLCGCQPSERSPRTALQKGGGASPSHSVGTAGAATARLTASAAAAVATHSSDLRRVILILMLMCTLLSIDTTMDFVKRHDEYEAASGTSCCGTK